MVVNSTSPYIIQFRRYIGKNKLGVILPPLTGIKVNCMLNCVASVEVFCVAQCTVVAMDHGMIRRHRTSTDVVWKCPSWSRYRPSLIRSAVCLNMFACQPLAFLPHYDDLVQILNSVRPIQGKITVPHHVVNQ